MYKTSKSPRKVLLVAHAIAKDALPPFAHRFAPKKFTQHQFFALLVLKEHQRCDYRKVVALLADCPELGAAIGLKKVPHFTTLQKAAARLLKLGAMRRLLASSLEAAQNKRC
jgi:hypothetical protein